MMKSDRQRYDRQISIEDFGERGQEVLARSCVAVVGLGGLGSSASMYLAAAGVGKLVLVDSDAVELSNLNRQLLHSECDVGRTKVASAVDALRAVNSTVELVGIDERLNEKNAADIICDADIVVDALDNFSSRFALNAACVRTKKPFVHGACRGFEGRLTTIVPFETPCFACIYPDELVDTKSPVLGATPGIIGAMEALEAIKFLAGQGALMKGRLMVFDGAEFRFEIVKVSRDRSCKVCGGGR